MLNPHYISALLAPPLQGPGSLRPISGFEMVEPSERSGGDAQSPSEGRAADRKSHLPRKRGKMTSTLASVHWPIPAPRSSSGESCCTKLETAQGLARQRQDSA